VFIFCRNFSGKEEEGEEEEKYEGGASWFPSVNFFDAVVVAECGLRCGWRLLWWFEKSDASGSK
jgi:hypothetical protein